MVIIPKFGGDDWREKKGVSETRGKLMGEPPPEHSRESRTKVAPQKAHSQGLPLPRGPERGLQAHRGRPEVGGISLPGGGSPPRPPG